MKPPNLTCCASHRRTHSCSPRQRTRYPPISSGSITTVPSAIYPRLERARVVARGVLPKLLCRGMCVREGRISIERKGAGKEEGGTERKQSQDEILKRARRRNTQPSAPLWPCPVSRSKRCTLLHGHFTPPTRADHHASPLREKQDLSPFSTRELLK